MRKKELVWIGLLLILGGLYIHFFSHWFDKKQIVISPSLRPSLRGDAAVFPVYFVLNEDYNLTSVKVVPVEDGAPASSETPVWQLVTDSNSVPTRAFRYGQHIGGMKPALAGVHADALQPDVIYRIVLAAGDVTGSADFKTKATGR